ncbi:MAG: AEC family transporter [Kiritimatiellae bacterium]|jgi:predicted permease|nr:AEC family transporter [Kiritimatiellia bacterium]
MMSLALILFPVFGLMMLGSLLRHLSFLDTGMEAAFNRFCYYVALPVFIVLKVARSPGITPHALTSAAALLLVTFGLLLAGYLFCMIFKINKRSRGTFVQTGFRGNLAYIGIPVIAYALGDQTPELRQQAETLAILTMAPTVLVYNLLGVMVLEWDRRHETTGHPINAWLSSTLRNPLIIACVAGLIWNLTSLPVPEVLLQIGTPLGSTAFPLALLAIGARIYSLPWKHIGPAAIGVSLTKNGLGLLLGWLVTLLFQLEGINQLVILILSSCPTAVATYVLVDQLDGDRDLAASAIAATTIGSLFGLAGALVLCKAFFFA